MEKKSLEKAYLNDDEQPTSLFGKIYGIIRSNWLALLCALLISIITIVVVPIIYTLQKPNNQNNQTNLSWDINGQTIINQTNLVNQITNNTIGFISALMFLNDDLYLLDKTKNRLLKYNFQSNYLSLIFGHLDGSNGSDLSSLSLPNDCINASQNFIYIADTFNHRIILIQLDSTTQGEIIFGTGQPGSNLSELNEPMSLTFDGQSNLYIADYGNNRIISFNLLTNQSQIIISYNPNSNRNSYVFTPISIKYDLTNNSLVIAQELGFNVVRWMLNSDTTTWTLIAGSASSELNGTSRTLFNKICSIDIDNDGGNQTYVNDCYNQRIQFYNGDMTKGRTIAGVIGAIGNNSYTFNHPTAITLDSAKNLYVADSNNFRIQKFQQLH